MNDGGDATLLLYKGKEMKEKMAKSRLNVPVMSKENEARQLQQDNKGFT